MKTVVDLGDYIVQLTIPSIKQIEDINIIICMKMTIISF
jgi:hypothetical protein